MMLMANMNRTLSKKTDVGQLIGDIVAEAMGKSTWDVCHDCRHIQIESVCIAGLMLSPSHPSKGSDGLSSSSLSK